jgi:glycosyltransferase involved in cell wall biosynthesis
MLLNKKIAILLSTYNGESYIEELFNSLLAQTNQDFILFIRDDGSSDGTRAIIDKYLQSNSNFIFVDIKGNKGSKQSFGTLNEYVLANYDFQYYMFADQDDVWLPDKVQHSLQKMMELENKYSEFPILLHTDLKVVDKNLKILSESFWNYQHLNPYADHLNRLLMQNIITGCTMMFNRRLAEICLPISHGAIMHDWWIGLVASAFGRIGFLQEPTILYRQHSENTVGAKKFNVSFSLKKMMTPILLENNVVQSKQFYDAYGNKLSPYHREMLLNFMKLSTDNYFSKVLIIIKYKFYKVGFIRNIGLFLKLTLKVIIK